ncbi:Epi-isozizaene synthase [Catellatospora sp. IY07-71]|uniref:terpene synthase family protein n=1 Tax=Catellatospora sp. IY07-71 TaxID=2728827 RepID=UPI001BB3975B|nr:terpene synthase [Catellatospora sp. IY07-71]BCJ70537.1 Epi-isozizaene synthase [Catellatospora sp. IY07-71]
MYAIPPVDCPIAPRLSPHVAEAERELTGWARKCGLISDDDGRRWLAAEAYAGHAGRIFPDVEPADLALLGMIFAWFYLIDDACDGSATPEPGRTRRYVTELLALLHGSHRPTEVFTGPARTMLIEIWAALRDEMPAAWQERFTVGVARYLAGVIEEAENKTAGRRPGVAEYVELRRAASAAEISHLLTEFATHTRLPDAIYHHPALRAVRTAGNDLLSWFNDLHSLDKDIATAGGHNLVLAIAHERGLPIEAAVPAAVAMWQERMDGFGALRARVPSFGAQFDGAVRCHLDGVARSVRGTLDWTLISGRYRTDAPETP